MSAFGTFERTLAWRYVRTKREHGGVTLVASISFIGIAMAVAVLIIVMSVMNGFRAELLNRIIGLNGHVYVSSQSIVGQGAIDVMAKRLAAVPTVTHVSPIIEGQVLAAANGQARGAIVRALRPQDLKALTIVSAHLTDGVLQGFGRPDGVVLGDRLAERLGVRVGDAVTLVAPNGAVTPFGVAPRRKTYVVAATFNIGMADYDEAFVFMPLGEGQAFFNQYDRVDRFELRTTNPDDLSSALAGARRVAGAGAAVQAWTDMDPSFFNALQVERSAMRLILLLIVAIAAMNIISGLVMLVKNKGRDIAILRTMGASRAAILRIFLMIGTGIGLAGAAFGLVAGVVFCLNIAAIQDFITTTFGVNVFSPDVYFLSHIPAKIDWSEVIHVVLWAGGMAMVATLPPALRASRLDPVEALRYE
jgi:lipoprotein-releasing system permease protein